VSATFAARLRTSWRTTTVLKCLAMVDDATTEAVAIVPARALGGLAVTRVLDRLAGERGLPAVLRTDNALVRDRLCQR
jgi:hypothetical protein